MSTRIGAAIYQQAGGRSLHGAINLTGGRRVTYLPDGDLSPIGPDDRGALPMKNGLMWDPNVRAHRTKFIVVLQPNDTYSVFLYKFKSPRSIAQKGIVGEVLQRVDDVYFDQLVDTIDAMYVAYIDEKQDGFISLG
jgi:hypothetical protein